jgi:hypothetical protein
MRKDILIAMTVVAGAALAAGAALSCSSVKCGANTHEAGGVCVANPDPLCGPGTHYSAGSCIPNEPMSATCGKNTRFNYDSGVCEGTAGPVLGDGGAGELPSTGVRWTGFKLVDPSSIAPIANLQLPSYFATGGIVVLVATDTANTRLYGGTGVKLADDPLTYSMNKGFKLDGQASVDGVGYVAADTGYVTDPAGHAFDWNFVFLPSQPPLDVRGVQIGFTMGTDGYPTSDGLAGTYTGCITDASAAALYIDVLSQTLKQLIDSNGGVHDCNDGTGDNTGYKLTAQWESSEIVTLDWNATAPTTDDGGTPDAG